MSTPGLVAAALAAAAAAWVLLSRGPPATARLGLPSAGPHDRRPAGRGSTGVVVFGGLAIVVVAVLAGFVLLVPSVVLILLTAVATVRRRTRRLARERRRDTCGSLLDALSAELRAGRMPIDALAQAAGSVSETPDAASARRTTRGASLDGHSAARSVLEPITEVVAVAGDVPGTLRAVGALDGAESCTWLAACWSVSAERGTGLVDATERIARSVQSDREHEAEVGSELSGVRATARLLAVLPVVGVGLGHAMGADVVGVLVGTPVGAALLTAGAALAVTGLVWVDALTRTSTDRRVR